MQLRKTRDDEIDAAYEVIEQARNRIASLGIDQWQNGSPNRGLLVGDVAREEAYVVDDDGVIIGNVMLTCSEESCYNKIDGSGWLTPCEPGNPNYLVVHRFAVSDDALGKGVAKFMLSEAESMARKLGKTSVRIDTHEGNIPMRTLLSKCGYEECGTVILDLNDNEATLERIGYEKLV